ncbi:chalcone isomerase family protein [Roseibium sp. FZY0029]|uniref:chalcone isomerase family protein n=1 Tax=Roseibium sp. FZY0029 TaxID=3116647 RepID=UPI002EBB819A|nr:chalcone isomerase family protein [Roseibium sp. FZY0029]
MVRQLTTHRFRWHGLAAALLLALTVTLPAGPARADLGSAARLMSSPELVGKGRMTFLGFKVFDAELYAPRGTYNPSAPFALKLTYLRSFKGKQIAESSVKEIRRQGGVSDAQLAKWQSQMEAIFPSVTPGQSITGVRNSSGHAEFYLGNRKLGTIADPAFTKKFFAIWLGGNTRDPQLRAKLVGSGS